MQSCSAVGSQSTVEPHTRTHTHTLAHRQWHIRPCPFAWFAFTCTLRQALMGFGRWPSNKMRQTLPLTSADFTIFRLVTGAPAPLPPHDASHSCCCLPSEHSLRSLNDLLCGFYAPFVLDGKSWLVLGLLEWSQNCVNLNLNFEFNWMPEQTNLRLIRIRKYELQCESRDVHCMQNMQSNLMSVKCLWMLALPLLLLLLLSDNECIHSIQSARCKCQKCRQVNHLIHLSISGQWTGFKQCTGQTNCELSSLVNLIALASLWTQASERVGSLATGQLLKF